MSGTGGGGGWLQTYSGTKFNPKDVDPDKINLMDIAMALSKQCRYNGHCLQFYSVADHSVRVSKILPKNLKMCGLMHDASEAYLGDVVRPLKNLLPQYSEIEEALMKVIAKKFEFEWPMPPRVKEADDILLATEQRDLLFPAEEQWTVAGVDPLKDSIVPLSHEQAFIEFSRTYSELRKKA